ncbi:glycosyltransferase family 2 protein [Prevotella sp. MA2016]|uniref:glycosyltransferase family 2 protein n=1 Tax=Prevotella sp. MA2016 TaxID=1408310 RepID=UPI000683F2AA|nr:glycosyltransferase family 2 protein [Prevotella sp. MA2016]
MKRVTVLLSTFNGEKYIEEQLVSVRNQKGVNIQIVVRDDGSSDNTCKILEEWHEKDYLTWYRGRNLKSARSFLDLLKNSGDSDFYAFCDQDDVWLEDKLISGIQKLEIQLEEKPSLYFSNYQMVDSNLNKIETPLKDIIYPDIYHSIISNEVTGCTLIINKALRDIINTYNPEFISMHDDWIYNVCISIGGIVVFDTKPHIFYRQHSNNVVGGIKDSFVKKNKVRLRKLFTEGEYLRSKLAKELISGYADDMSKDVLNELTLISNNRLLKNRFKILINTKHYKGLSLERKFKFISMILFNKF